jgi:cobalt-zinc-cadmium resistance protein CzcA
VAAARCWRWPPVVYTQVGKTFMPTMDEGDIIVGIEKLPSVSLEQTAALDLRSSRR